MKWFDGITDSMDISLSKLWESEGQGSLVCCSPWGHKELNMAERLNNNNKSTHIINFMQFSSVHFSRSVVSDFL